jgi:hypothetical protein
VERQAHAEAARGIRARLVLERGAVRRKATAQELVRVERAPAGRGPFAARRAALSEDLRDLFRLGMESISRDAVEFELARQRGHGEPDDLVGVQGEEGSGGELEERDGLLAPFHQRPERALALQDVTDGAREEANAFLRLGLSCGHRLQHDSEGGRDLILNLHGRSVERESALADLLRTALRENLTEMLIEACLRGRRDAGPASPRHGRNADAGKQGHDGRIEEVERGGQNPTEGLVEEQTFLEGAVERLEERQAWKARKGSHRIGRHNSARWRCLDAPGHCGDGRSR